MLKRAWAALGLGVLVSLAGCGQLQTTTEGKSERQVLQATVTLNATEQELYNLIMEYRRQNGLPEIPLSASLTRVARLHVDDLRDNQPNTGNCNLHSWSNKGTWTPVCYTDDHAQASGMWNKPRELTSYQGNGYEISHGGTNVTPASALAGWKGSSAHSDVILNKGIWSQEWKAIGIGINNNYANIWFGREAE